MTSEPPDEFYLRSEPSVLSPASPKPIHFPAPTNIHVLEMQMDVGFNQTEAHMLDPAMRNTDLRPDVWRDPKEQGEHSPAVDQPSPYSTGGEALLSAEHVGNPAQSIPTAPQETAATGKVADSNHDTTMHHHHTESVPLSATHAATDVASVDANPAEPIPHSSDPRVPTTDATASGQDVSQAYATRSEGKEQVQPSNSTFDVQTLLNNHHPASSTAAEDDASNPTLIPAPQSLHPHSQSPTQDPTQAQTVNVSATPLEVEESSGPNAAASSSLPPRPPPQEQPLMHPNYVHSQQLRDYHPHAANPAFQPHTRTGSQSNTTDPNSRAYAAALPSPTSTAAATLPTPQAQAQTNVGGYATSLAIPTDAGSTNGYAQQQQQAPPGTAYTPAAVSNLQTATPGYSANPQNPYGMQYPSSSTTNTPIESRRERVLREGEQPRPEDRPWDAEVQRKYDRFIEDERKYVSEGRWEQFPPGSRLFVGNLSSEKVTKRDIFHVFHTYGDLAQISIKQAYGFVQFLRTEDCMSALHREQGTQIRDKKIHLEVSKPQKNRPSNNNSQRRSRSPVENSRSRSGANNVDRYVSSGNSRSSNNRNNNYRSPSPPNRGYRDRYDDRYRRRSRSPPDYSRGGGGRYSSKRSPSPRGGDGADDDLPLPRRKPDEVPDVQILVLDQLERDFISWVEGAFSAQGLRVGVLILSPRLSELAVVRRQIVEGVVAVVKLVRQDQDSGKIGVQVFDRSRGGGTGNVTFEEYQGLDPPVVGQLVMRAKQTKQQPPAYAAPPQNQAYAGYALPPPPQQQQQQQQQYNAPPPPGVSYGNYAPPPPAASYPGGPPQGSPTSYQPPSGYGNNSFPPPPTPAGGAPPPHLQNLLTNLDPNNLQSLLSAMGGTPGSGNAYSAPPSAVPPAAGYGQQPPQQQYGPGGAGQQQVSMQDILARLGNGGQR